MQLFPRLKDRSLASESAMEADPQKSDVTSETVARLKEKRQLGQQKRAKALDRKRKCERCSIKHGQLLAKDFCLRDIVLQGKLISVF